MLGAAAPEGIRLGPEIRVRDRDSKPSHPTRDQQKVSNQARLGQDARSVRKPHLFVAIACSPVTQKEAIERNCPVGLYSGQEM